MLLHGGIQREPNPAFSAGFELYTYFGDKKYLDCMLEKAHFGKSKMGFIFY